MYDELIKTLRLRAAEGGMSMGVYIKGMEMPTRCCECRLSTCHSFKERPLCDVLVKYMSYGEWEAKRLDDCPLVPAADVKPVVVCRDCKNDCHCMIQDFLEEYGITPDDQNNFFCGYGEKEDQKDER